MTKLCCAVEFMSGHLTEYDALFARTSSMHFVEHLRDGCIGSTQTMREVKLVCNTSIQSSLLANPSRNFVRKLHEFLSPHATITTLSNLHSSLSISPSDLPCVLFRKHDREFLRQVCALTVIGSIDIEEKKELIYLITCLSNVNDPNSIVNSIAVTPKMHAALADTHITIAGTIGIFNDEVETLVRNFGLAYVKKPNHPVIALTEKCNRCSVTLRSRETCARKLQALLGQVEDFMTRSSLIELPRSHKLSFRCGIALRRFLGCLLAQ